MRVVARRVSSVGQFVGSSMICDNKGFEPSSVGVGLKPSLFKWQKKRIFGKKQPLLRGITFFTGFQGLY